MVTLKNGILTVEANNSDLSQILKDVAGAGGMTIDGAITNARVFGVYGPSSPGNVLTSLLIGAGYNFAMVGVTHEGTPRELVLTSRSVGSPLVSVPNQVSPAFNHLENSEANTPSEDHLGPGAIANVPPVGPEDPQERAKQNLQRLQQVHDQQKQPPQ